VLVVLVVTGDIGDAAIRAEAGEGVDVGIGVVAGEVAVFEPARVSMWESVSSPAR
jgi:hypothetical protein